RQAGAIKTHWQTVYADELLPTAPPPPPEIERVVPPTPRRQEEGRIRRMDQTRGSGGRQSVQGLSQWNPPGLRGRAKSLHLAWEQWSNGRARCDTKSREWLL